MLGEGRGLSSRPTHDVVRDLEIGPPSNSEKCSEAADGVTRESEGGGRLSLLRSVRQDQPRRHSGACLCPVPLEQGRAGHRAPLSTLTCPCRARCRLPRRERSRICARSYSAIMPWNCTSNSSSGVEPRGARTNKVSTPARANSSIKRIWCAYRRLNRSGA